MNGTNNNTTFKGKKETSKVFIRMGEYVRIKAVRKSQRGIIAKRFLQIVEDLELKKFEEQLPHFKLTTLKINQGDKTFYL